jgi:putative membrane protein
MLLPAAAIVAMHAGHGPGFGWLFFLVPLFWIGIFALFFALMRRRSRSSWDGRGPGSWGGPGGQAPWSGAASAERVLAERFARGDIDEVEYRARLEVLRAQ